MYQTQTVAIVFDQEGEFPDIRMVEVDSNLELNDYLELDGIYVNNTKDLELESRVIQLFNKRTSLEEYKPYMGHTLSAVILIGWF